MAPDPKQIVELTMDSQESLCLPVGTEAAHLALLFSGMLVRHFCTIVGVSVLAMWNRGHDLAFRCSITTQPVRGELKWCLAL